jgi:hypothetical protein
LILLTFGATVLKVIVLFHYLSSIKKTLIGEVAHHEGRYDRCNKFQPFFKWRGLKSKTFELVENRECYRENHPDKTNLRILNFADNKDLHGGGLNFKRK